VRSLKITPALQIAMLIAAFGFSVPRESSALIEAEAATLEFQVRNSDVILRGTCEDSLTTWSNHHLVTTYKIAVEKYLKAPAKMSVQTNPVIRVSQIGGRVSRPLPLAEVYPMMPVLYKGEKVVLFLKSPDSIPKALREKYERCLADGVAKPFPLMTDYRLTTLNISKLTIVTDPTTGREIVTRIGFERFGFLPTSEAVKRYVEAYETQKEFVDVRRGTKLLRVPVQIGVMRLEPQGKGAKAKASKPIEQRMREMLSYASTWEDFQRQVEAILQGEKRSAVPTTVDGRKMTKTYRTILPRKDQ